MRKPYADQQRRTLIVAITLFLLLAAAIIFVGYRSYRNFEANAREETEALLAMITDAKLRGLSDWRGNLLDNANLIYRNETFAEILKQYAGDGQNAAARARLLNWLAAYKKNVEFDGVFVLDAQGGVMLAAPPEETVPGADVTEELRQAAQNGEIVFVDFYRNADGRIHLAALIPIADKEKIIGYVFLRVDPRAHLYPLLAQQASEKAQAQSFLARRDQAGAVFLTPLKFMPDAPLNLVAGVKDKENLAIKAVAGQTGIAEGLDYRGVEMIADIQPVPDSPWFLVTHIAKSEVYAPVTQNFGRTVIVTGTLIFYLGLGAVLIWRQRQLKYFQSEAEAAETLRQTQEELLRLTEQLDLKVRERTAELQDANQQLRALSRQMVDMQERQIKDLARELHDRIGQNLTAININLSLALQLLPKDSPADVRARLADTTRLVEETVARMRNVVAEFLPPMLESYGLLPALAWYGKQFEARTNIKARVNDDRSAETRLAPEVEIGLFRIAQEALNNVAKHAQATRVNVELKDDGRDITLTICDDGQGFDPQAVAAQPGHWGLAMMRERAKTLGAALEIEAAAGKGAKIILRVPR